MPAARWENVCNVLACRREGGGREWGATHHAPVLAADGSAVDHIFEHSGHLVAYAHVENAR